MTPRDAVKRAYHAALHLKGELARAGAIYRRHRFSLEGRTIRMKSPSKRQVEVMRNHTFTDANAAKQRRYFEVIGFRPGDVLVDVGANIGYISALYASLFPSSPVLAFEPSRLNRRFLTDNVRGFPQIKIFPVGAHHEASKLKLSMPSSSQNPRAAAWHYHNSGLLSMYGDSGRDAETIDLVVLDRFVPEKIGNKRIGFMKVDVEGNELNVLKGAREILAQHGPAVEVEMNPRAFSMSGTGFREIRDFMAPLGYRPFVFDGAQLLEFKKEDVSDIINMVFIKRAA